MHVEGNLRLIQLRWNEDMALGEALPRLEMALSGRWSSVEGNQLGWIVRSHGSRQSCVYLSGSDRNQKLEGGD